VLAVTLHQPWASLVAEGHKRYETRSWIPRVAGEEYRGPLVIHAAATVPAYAREFARTCKEAQEMLAYFYGDCWEEDPAYTLPTGKALVVVYLSTVEKTEMIRDRLEALEDFTELAFGDWADGRYAWRLASPLDLGGIPWQGRQKLWEFPDELIPSAVLKASKVPA
jgi:hypothetical protein